MTADAPRTPTLAAKLKVIGDLVDDARQSVLFSDGDTAQLAVPRTLTPEEVAVFDRVARAVADRDRSVPLTSTTMRLIRVMEDVVEAQDCAASGNDDADIHMVSAAARLVEAVVQMAASDDYHPARSRRMFQHSPGAGDDGAG